jgi:hypothetical protein
MRRRARRQSAALVSLALALGCLLVATSVSAAWTPHVNVAKQQQSKRAVVEMDAAGDAVFVWGAGDPGTDAAIYTRVRAADGTFSPIQRIVGESPYGYDLAVDSDGDAYYVWTDSDSSGRDYLRMRVRLADGTLSPVQTLKTVGPSEFVSGTVGVDASGTAVVGWTHHLADGTERFQARKRSPSGALGPVYDVATGHALKMAVDASGNATFVWQGVDGALGVFTRVLAANGSLGSVTRVSQAGRHGSEPQVVVTPAGRAVFEWEDYDEDAETDNLVVRGRLANGTFQPRQIVARPFAHQEGPDPHLAIAPTGEAAFTWNDDETLHARTRAPGGGLGPVMTVTPSLVHWSDIGIDSQGNVVFAWGTPPAPDKSRVFVRTADADGTPSPTRAVSLAGYNAYFPDVAMTPAGAAAVGWQAGNGGFAIQATFGP